MHAPSGYARRVLATLLVLSGASALVYEVLWARDWTLVYGATATGSAVVLAATFAGLALGAVLGQRLAGGTRPARTFALLEAGVVASVLAYLVLRPALPELADGLRAHVPLAALALAFVTLAPTAILLGATLPVIAAAGDPVRLYAWNTFGGAAGALATTVLVPQLGLRATYLLAALADAAVAGAAWRLDARPTAHPALGAGAGRASTATLVAALSGALALAAEVLWMRGLTGVLSSSPYSVAIVLAVVLAGVAGAVVVTLAALTRSLRALQDAVQQLHDETLPLADELREAVTTTTYHVERVERIITAAESVEDRIDNASRLAYRTMQSPVVKAMAFSAGVQRTAQRLAGRDPQPAPVTPPPAKRRFRRRAG